MDLRKFIAMTSVAFASHLAAAGPTNAGELRPIDQKPLRELFDTADYVAFVLPRKLEATAGGYSGTFTAGRLFKGKYEQADAVSWLTRDFSTHPRSMGKEYLALLRNGSAVTRDAGFLEVEYFILAPDADVGANNCFKDASHLTCRGFKVRNHLGVIFDPAMIRRVKPTHPGGCELEIEIVLVEDVERAFCDWTACKRQHFRDVPDIDPNLRKG